MEGWAQVRIAGQTEWKRLWVVLSVANTNSTTSLPSQANQNGKSATPAGTANGRKRISNLFGGSSGSVSPPIIKSSVALYQTQKAREKRKPDLTMYDITQAFAVYPERPEMISKSTLLKIEGTMGNEDPIGNMRNREAWILMMPEQEEGSGKIGVMEMLKWAVGEDKIHLYAAEPMLTLLSSSPRYFRTLWSAKGLYLGSSRSCLNDVRLPLRALERRTSSRLNFPTYAYASLYSIYSLIVNWQRI